MKRYISLGLFILLTITSITFFYIKSHETDRTLPRFQFEKMSGDEKYIEKIKVFGNLFSPYGDVKDFDLTSSATIYDVEKPYFKQIQYGYLEAEQNIAFDRWKKDYRSFMRGDTMWRTYFEDDHSLVYVGQEYDLFGNLILGMGIENYTIGVYDKKTDKMYRFETEIPNSTMDTYNDIVDVTYANGKVNILTVQTETGESGADGYDEVANLHVQTFDVAAEEIVEDKFITGVQLSGGEESYGYVDVLVAGEGKDKQLLLTHYDSTYTDSGIDVLTVKEAMRYDVETETLTTIDLPKEGFKGDIVSFDQDNLYFTKQDNDQLTVGKYDIEKQKVEEVIAPITLDTEMYNESKLVEDGVLYIARPPSQMQETGNLVALDLPTMKTVYEGKITMESSEEKFRQMYEIEFLDMLLEAE